MGYLEPHEAENLLRNPDPDFKMRYADGVIEEILPRPTDGLLPRYPSQPQPNHDRHPRPPRSRHPRRLHQRRTLLHQPMARIYRPPPEEVHAGQQILIAIAHSITPHSLAARRRMIRFHLIQDNNTIEIPLFDRWITDRAI
jgi:hypothetical protein